MNNFNQIHKIEKEVCQRGGDELLTV